MKLFKRSAAKPTISAKSQAKISQKKVTVDSIREKLADYQKTEGRACFIQNDELTYLHDGSIAFESVANSGESTMAFSVPFTMA